MSKKVILEPTPSNANQETAPAPELIRSPQTPPFTSDDKLREQAALLNLAHDAIFVRDLESKIRFWNRGAEDAYGWSAAEAYGRKAHELLQTQLPAPLEEILAVLREQEEWEGELKHVRQDGRPIIVDSRWSLQRDETGAPKAILEINRDITEHVRAEEAQAELQQKILAANREWELTFGSVPEMILLLDEQRRIVRANRAVSQIAKGDLSELTGKFCYESLLCGLVPPEGCPRSNGTAGEQRVKFQDSDSGRAFEAHVKPIQDPNGACGFVCVMQDVTERKRYVEALRQSEERYRDLLDNANDIIFTIDLAGNFKSFNRAAERISGYTQPEALRLNISQLMTPESFAMTVQENERLLAGGTPSTFEVTLLSKSARRMDLEINNRLLLNDGNAVGFQGVGRDISERKKLEAQIIQAQKMDALGRLAGGVAHDFNNLLGAILGYGELLLDATEPGSGQRQHIEQIKKAAERGASLTRQLLALHRRQEHEERVLDLNAMLSESEKLIRRMAGENIELITVLGSRDGHIKADPAQMDQVILNLALNSRDAMPQGGTLTIETSDSELDEHFARLHPEVRPGRYVMLAVSDTGTGIDPETQAHIFEPFFTTKPRGKGTGLGLFTVYGIVRQSNGHISVYSEPGKGTTFKIFLPRAEQPASEMMAKTEARGAASLLNGSETILVVEDDLAVRTVVRKFLEQNGYRVLEAENPARALQIADANEASIHLLLTDVVMPGMNGRQLAERLAAHCPQLKVLYMSGYTDNAMMSIDPPAPGIHFIGKPFSQEALLHKVREALDATKINAKDMPKHVRGEELL